MLKTSNVAILLALAGLAGCDVFAQFGGGPHPVTPAPLPERAHPADDSFGHDQPKPVAADDVAAPHMSPADLDGVVTGLRRLPMAERWRRLGNLIDSYYLTVAQAGEILGVVPIPDQRRALDVMACSVVDPEHADRITKVVVYSDRSEAIAILTQKCFAKFPHDRRPPGRMAQKAAPPPGALVLPGED
jgi:hypothetical protein